jgi:hypothetical protein
MCHMYTWPSSPCAGLCKHYAMETYGGVDIETDVFLTLAVFGGEWSASRPGRFTPGEEPQVPIG